MLEAFPGAENSWVWWKAFSIITAMYCSTTLVFKSKEISADMGMMQDGATSGILFII